MCEQCKCVHLYRITVWWPGVEQRLCFETVLGDLLITASIVLVKDSPWGLAYDETGKFCCKQESFTLFITLPALRLAHGTQLCLLEFPLSKSGRSGGVQLASLALLVPIGLHRPHQPYAEAVTSLLQHSSTCSPPPVPSGCWMDALFTECYTRWQRGRHLMPG